MKAIIVCVISLIYSCIAVFGAKSLYECNQKLEATMSYCFKKELWTTGIYKSSADLKTMRTVCMQNSYCKSLAKKCLLSQLQGSNFYDCPIARTYISSINRMFR
ncbi:unnamed protein product [Schistosoma turkestanicum]|nr:unnamed protein product [Schistosoma turkestanicum]